MPTMWQHQRKQTSWGLANITFFACEIVSVFFWSLYCEFWFKANICPQSLSNAPYFLQPSWIKAHPKPYELDASVRDYGDKVTPGTLPVQSEDCLLLDVIIPTKLYYNSQSGTTVRDDKYWQKVTKPPKGPIRSYREQSNGIIVTTGQNRETCAQ